VPAISKEISSERAWTANDAERKRETAAPATMEEATTYE
jgi:hypothetical protein